ncbi:hypothetical protein C8R45DRAFT_1223225 [Mycena sanguinolenta]|nr:hypothetical protein C8R45DRAFT_1223225 [Mycena sanguinolenta]
MAVNDANAVILIASWINMSLYTLEIILAIKYFQRPKRPLWHKIGVASFVIADAVCTVGIGWEVYLNLFVLPCVDVRAVEFLHSLYWAISLTILSTYTTASLEQAFLCALFYSMTKRRFLTGLLVFSIFFHLGFSWTSAALVLKHRNPGGKAFIATQIGAISCAVTDRLIAVVLGYAFYQMGSRTIKGRSTHRRETALVFTLSTHFFLLFFYSQGRAYALTLLAYALTLLANFMLGVPVRNVESDLDASSRTVSGRRTTDSGVVFHVGYGPRNNADLLTKNR